MAVQATHVFNAQLVNNLKQNQPGQAPGLLQSSDVLTLIARQVVNETNTIEAGENAVHFGRVCAFTHLVSHDENIQEAIKGAFRATTAQKVINLSFFDVPPGCHL
jgi:hypothetical protein